MENKPNNQVAAPIKVRAIELKKVTASNVPVSVPTSSHRTPTYCDK